MKEEEVEKEMEIKMKKKKRKEKDFSKGEVLFTFSSGRNMTRKEMTSHKVA